MKIDEEKTYQKTVFNRQLLAESESAIKRRRDRLAQYAIWDIEEFDLKKSRDILANTYNRTIDEKEEKFKVKDDVCQVPINLISGIDTHKFSTFLNCYDDLGQGAFGVVRKCKLNDKGRRLCGLEDADKKATYAVKFIELKH